MKPLAWSVTVVLGLIIFLLVGVLAGKVGGVAIRKQSAIMSNVILSVSEPMMRGVPVRIEWIVGQMVDRPVNIFYRENGRETQIGQARWQDGRAVIQVPCSIGGVGTLLIRQVSGGQMITSLAVELAPPGPECVIGANI